jgi:hypothetical protein
MSYATGAAAQTASSQQSVSHIDFSAIVATGQQTNVILTQILAALRAGIVVLPDPAIYTVAGLPLTGANGQMAFASNARKPGQGAGAGTGLPVFFDSASATWLTAAGVAITV